MPFSEAGIAPPPPEQKAGKRKQVTPSTPSAAGKGPIAPRTIGVDEIEPGIVVWLEPAILLEDSRVCHTQDPPVLRRGPFVCVATEGDRATWAGLTATDLEGVRPSKAAGSPVGRLAIKPEWRSGGWRRWRSDPQFLTDGSSLWRGPREAFVKASGPGKPGRLSPDGLHSVRTEIELQRHRRHRACED